jgi:hypothetical protein
MLRFGGRLSGGTRMIASLLLCHAIPCLSWNAVSAQRPREIGVAGRSNDAVRLASDGAFVAMVFRAATKGGMDVFCVTSRDGGNTFTAPVRVNSTPLEARGDGEQPPLVALTPQSGGSPRITVVWNARRTDGTRLLSAQSTDGGATFTRARDVPGSNTPGDRGWVSIATTPRGTVHVLWIDHRAHRARAAGSPKLGPVEFAGLSEIRTAVIGRESTSRVIATSPCYCCKTAFTSGVDGALYGAWRHVFPGDFRDIALTVSTDGGRSFTPPARVSADQWEFDGCPDNGPAVAVDDAKRVHVIWPTPADRKNPDKMALFYAQSRDGTTFSERVPFPSAVPSGYVNLTALPGGALVAVWGEFTSAGRTVRMARGDAGPDGRMTFRAIAAPAPGKYPAVTVIPSGALVAWTTPNARGTMIAVAQVTR